MKSRGCGVRQSIFLPCVRPSCDVVRGLDEGGEWPRRVAQREAAGDLRTRQKEGHLLLDPGDRGVAELGGCCVGSGLSIYLGWFPRTDASGLGQRLPCIFARCVPEASVMLCPPRGGGQMALCLLLAAGHPAHSVSSRAGLGNRPFVALILISLLATLSIF